MSISERTWLLREGDWYLLAKDQCGEDMQGYARESMIWHQCKGVAVQSCYKGCWRLGGVHLETPCGVCGEVCPSGIIALWRFHNWETMDGTL